MADVEEPPIDDFFQELEELLRGRFYYTIYTHQHNSHNRFFKRGNLKLCLIIGIIITFLYEFAVVTQPAEPEIRGIREPHVQPSSEEEPSNGNLVTRYPMFKGHGEHHPFDPARERYSRPSSFNYVNVVRTVQESIEEALMAEKSQGNGKGTNKLTIVQYIYQFVIRLCIITGLAILVYFISELVSIVHDVVIRHIISVKKQRLIGGLIRFRRIT